MTEQNLKKTTLHAAHIKAGARMVPFGGWDMPVQYSGLVAEHNAVRKNVGVFDVSHMGEFRITGAQALDFLQHVTTNDVAKLKPGRAAYNWLPNDKGGLVDDIFIYQEAENNYLMVVNAGNIDKDWAHLQGLAGGFDVTLANESDDWALLAVQGPNAAATLAPHATPDLKAAKRNSYFAGELFGVPVRFAVTGYTGEAGFEVFVRPDSAETVWDKMLEIGVTPAGLGARDTLRLEAGFPLYGHEFSEEIHPLSSHYGWVAKDKPHHGRDAIKATPTQRLIGLKLDKIPAREGYLVFAGGEQVGTVTSGSTSPSLGHPIAFALVKAEAAEAESFEIEVRGKRHPASVMPVPFYSKPKA